MPGVTYILQNFFFFSPGNPSARKYLICTGEVEPQNVRAEKLPGVQLVLGTRTEVALDSSCGFPLLPVHCTTLSLSQDLVSAFSLSSVPPPALLFFFLFDTLWCFGCFSLFFAFTLPAAGFTKETKRHQQDGNIRLPFFFFCSFPVMWQLVGYLWKCIMACEIWWIGEVWADTHIHCLTRPGEIILSPCGNSLFSECFDLSLQGEMPSYGAISQNILF